MTDKIAPEVAEQEFDRYIEAWDIDTTCDTEDDEKAFDTQKRRIVSGIMKQHVTVDESGEAVTILPRYKRKNGDDPIVLDINKANMLIMDKYKDKQNLHKLNAYISTMAGVEPKVINGLDVRDYKTIQAIVLLFMG